MKATPNGGFPLHFTTADPDLDRLLKPSSAYQHPTDVVDDPDLSLAEKKAILASWASDACAVECRPGYRHPPALPEPVSFDAIMSALQALDRRRGWDAHRPWQRDRGQDSNPLC